MPEQASQGQAPPKVEEVEGPATFMAFTFYHALFFPFLHVPAVWMAGNCPGGEIPKKVQVTVLPFLGGGAA